MDPEERVGQRSIAGERVEKGRFELSSSSCNVRDCREPREPESDDSRDVLRCESEVGVCDDACQGRRTGVRGTEGKEVEAGMSSSSTKHTGPASSSLSSSFVC